MEWDQSATAAKRPLPPWGRVLIVAFQRGAAFFSRHWLLFVNGFWGLLLLGALLPPAFMALGWEGAAKVGYTIYSFTCHQLPERSFFLFSPQGTAVMHDLGTLVAAGADSSDLLRLRQFVGSPTLGWKLGFSDRMVSMYGGAFLAGLLFWLASRRRPVQPIPIWLLLLLILPMALDGTSHLISEVTQLGFRDTNAWARPLFGAQPDTFYTDTTLGTLNSTLRLVTGLMFGLGMMLFAYPLIGYSFEELSDEAEKTLARNEAVLRMDA